MSTTSTTVPAAIQERRPNPPRRRLGRLSGVAARGAGSSCGGDVEMDNGPRALCHEPLEQIEGVDAARVSAFERDLQRVLTDQGHVVDPQLVRIEAAHL